VPEPMYRLIAEDLRQKIESAELAPGSQLGTELELRDSYSASRTTIREAVKWLVIRGLVETRPGQGTFVTAKFEPFVTTLSGDWQEESGLGGGEGRAALAEVQARKRTPEVSEPSVEVKKAYGYVTESAFPSDRNQFVINAGEVPDRLGGAAEI
jgi:DNA-binding GntR family transcriptional regulator